MECKFVVWHFASKTFPQLLAIVDNEDLAKKACEIGDCYMPIEINRIYKEEIDSSEFVMYKCPDGSFKDYTDYCKELKNINSVQ